MCRPDHGHRKERRGGWLQSWCDGGRPPSSGPSSGSRWRCRAGAKGGESCVVRDVDSMRSPPGCAMSRPRPRPRRSLPRVEPPSSVTTSCRLLSCIQYSSQYLLPRPSFNSSSSTITPPRSHPWPRPPSPSRRGSTSGTRARATAPRARWRAPRAAPRRRRRPSRRRRRRRRRARRPCWAGRRSG